MIANIKQELAIAFSDNNGGKAWYRWLEYGIMACLILNAVETFLSTYETFNQQYARLLYMVDVFTTVVFFIEVSLRIWVADLQDERYHGVIGRIRYCLTPYGLIDVVSTYPCVLGFFFVSGSFLGLSPIVLKSLRVLRLIRIFRFMKAFRLLGNAFAHKREEPEMKDV